MWSELQVHLMSSWSYNPNCFLDAKRLTYRIPSESGLDLSQKLQMLEGGRGVREGCLNIWNKTVGEKSTGGTRGLEFLSASTL